MGLNEWTKEQQDKLIKDLASVGITNPKAVADVMVIPRDDDDIVSTLTQQLLLGNNVLIFGESGWGKALPNYQGVLTPNGYIPIGEIKVGDLVASNDGKFYPVLGVYPQGKKPVYEITFNYGIKTRCSDEHIWTISRDDGETYHNETLNEIMKRGYKSVDRETGLTRHTVSLPLVEPIGYPGKELPIDPYLQDKKLIYDIQYVAEEECTCIEVAAPNHLFLTEHCIPTHNTQIVNQVADRLGYRIQPITVATKLPEDFGGRPMGITEELPQKTKEAIARVNLAKRKASAQLEEEVKKLKASGAQVDKWRMQRLHSKLMSSQQIDKEELDKEIEDMEIAYKSRKKEIYAAPDWVYQIIDSWIMNGQKTVLFLDEINQASAQTLNTLFQLVDARRFADRPEYDMSEAIVCVAAGNFLRENRVLTKLPAPLVRRFSTVIYFLGVWGDAVDYLREKYSYQPEIVKLLDDIAINCITDGKLDDFENPAKMEAAIKSLSTALEKGIYIKGAKQVIRSPGTAQKLIEKFIIDNDLNNPTRAGGPGEATETDTIYGDANGSAQKRLSLINSLMKLWKDFYTKGFTVVAHDDGRREVFTFGKPGPSGKAGYLQYLKGLEDWKDIRGDVWGIIENATPQDIAAWKY
jgi:hypothetical protein